MLSTIRPSCRRHDSGSFGKVSFHPVAVYSNIAGCYVAVSSYVMPWHTCLVCVCRPSRSCRYALLGCSDCVFFDVSVNVVNSICKMSLHWMCREHLYISRKGSTIRTPCAEVPCLTSSSWSYPNAIYTVLAVPALSRRLDKG